MPMAMIPNLSTDILQRYIREMTKSKSLSLHHMIKLLHQMDVSYTSHDTKMRKRQGRHPSSFSTSIYLFWQWSRKILTTYHCLQLEYSCHKKFPRNIFHNKTVISFFLFVKLGNHFTKWLLDLTIGSPLIIYNLVPFLLYS